MKCDKCVHDFDRKVICALCNHEFEDKPAPEPELTAGQEWINNPPMLSCPVGEQRLDCKIRKNASCFACEPKLAKAYDQGMADWDAWPKPEPAMTALEWSQRADAPLGRRAVVHYIELNKGKVIQ